MTTDRRASNRRWPATALGLATLAGLPVLAPAADTATPATDTLTEVVVTGMRADLDKSLQVKKDADVVLDSINSTELGRFPDADVADSLAHLPGITISRTTGGEGEKVSVRGLGPQYNIVTLNNRILATDDDSRDIAFDVLPAEVIAGADVLKSAQASAVEGSIGATVNLRTASPFEHPGLHAGVHLEGNDNTMSRLRGGKLSAFVEDTNDDQTLGFLLGAVHSDDHIRTDSLNAYNQNYYGPTQYPWDGSGNPVTLVATPCCITFGSIFDNKRRDALSGSLEWRPSSTLQVTADALYTRLIDPQIGYNESYYFATDPTGTGWSNPTIQNGLVTAVTVSNFQPEMVNNTIDRRVSTSMLGLNLKWQPFDSLTIKADGYQSNANRPEGGGDSFVTAGLVSATPNAQDTLYLTDLPHSLPSLNVVVPPSQLGLTSCPAGTQSAVNPAQCSYTALMNSGFLNNNKYWSTHYDGLNGYSVHDKVDGLTLDGAWEPNAGFLHSVLFGAGYTNRDKSRVDSSNDWTNGSGQYGSLYLTAGGTVQPNPYSFGSQGFNVISMVNLPNFMQGAGGSYPTTLPQLNVPALLAFLQSLNGKPNPQFCSTSDVSSCQPGTAFNFANTLPQPNPYNSYAVTEKTFSLYGQGNFKSDRWSGNLGVRLVHTSTTASTANAIPISLWTNNPSATTTQTWNVQYSPTTPENSKGSYTMVLPSLNASYWLRPDTLRARLAIGESMSRPDLDQLAPTSTNNAINGTPQLYYNGTAGLKPIKATQGDLSLEWYYRKHAMLSAALFEKRIINDIYTAVQTNVNLGTLQYVGGQPGTVPGTPFPWTVTAPANGDKSTFSGIEVTWQHTLDSGFGVHAQFTATRSRGYDQAGNFVGAINAAPPTTESVGLIYDKGPLSADINWDHQSRFTYESGDSTEIPGWPAISDPFDWVTASVHFKFLHGFEVYAEGKNLTNAIARTYLNGNPLLPWAPGQSVGQSASGTGVGYSAYGRSYVLGIAYQH